MYNLVETAEFVQLVNDWFHIHNSTLGIFTYPGKKAFGLALGQQQEILLRMNKIMGLCILPYKRSLEQFQKGVIVSNTALIILHKYVCEKYNIKYICTSRLNQDVLENFF